ncbi:hypothetical protein NESM_000807600 [Novymonas esmeraldas]|uniref:Uncharacterized protein n=1 Tax=Novymonas esmeraldas TaxID=1808958 RepID=A0AAW0EWJ3_9TRYP
MPAYSKEQAHVRRIFAAPDRSSELLATCDKAYVPSLTYTAATRSVAVAAVGDAAVPRVRLPSPAIDLAWCSFKNAAESATYATACRSQPIQLWDAEDAELRASYTAHNDSDYHVHPHALCWFAAPTQQHWIAGGYGGFEDVAQVRVFDIVSEGSAPVWTYGSRQCAGLVSALWECQWPGTTSLLAVGYHSAPAVHLVDCRKRCPAAELRGLRHGVQVLRAGGSGTDPYCIYAGGSQGDSRIACWDVRRPGAPLFTLARAVHTNQVFQFDVLPSSASTAAAGGGAVSDASSASGCTRRLVTTCSTGGVVLYRWRAGEVPDSDAAVHVGVSVGPTSGLAVVGPDTVVVSTGCRSYDVPPLRRRGGAVQPAVSRLHGRNDGDDVDGDAESRFPAQKRPRSPMTSDDEETQPAAQPAQLPTTEPTNVAVVVLDA